MTMPRWPRIAAIALIGAALILWLAWPRHKAAPEPAGTVRVVPTGTPSPRAAAATPERAEAPTRDWLLGTWSQRDNKGAGDAPCDQASAVTYLPGGQYFARGASGRYALGTGTISYWGRIVYDIDAGEDRSHFEERSSSPVARIDAHAMQLGGTLLYRCLKAASDRAS
ncbi:hypothetical protein [Sphingomonas sp. KR3-1]|uniref:hypothetical protein n=1 Tax=Sphingomonas sp. KR3-1 TaxID=3156611 RepID=UPI0032B5DE43